MGQEEMTASVRGLLVASSSYDGESICPVVLSSPPFKAERKKLGRRAKSAAGVLIASYDA